MSGGADRWIRWTTTGCVGLLALIAGSVSCLHMHALVAEHGQHGWVAALTPSVDGTASPFLSSPSDSHSEGWPTGGGSKAGGRPVPCKPTYRKVSVSAWRACHVPDDRKTLVRNLNVPVPALTAA